MNQQKNICPYCGYLISTEARFCLRCGNQLKYGKDENTKKNTDVSPPQKEESTNYKKLLPLFISVFIFIVVIIIATRKNSNSNVQNDNAIANNYETLNDNAITNNYETPKAQQNLVMQGHPKLEILEITKLTDNLNADTLVSQKILVNEEGDTLEKENMAFKTIFIYDDHGRLTKEYHYTSKVPSPIDSPKPDLVYILIYNYDANNHLIKKVLRDSDNKEYMEYEAKYDNNKIIESSIYKGLSGSSKITFYYNEDGLPIKAIYSWLDWKTIYEYSDNNKLISESTYNYIPWDNDYALINQYNYNYEDGLLVRKSYTDNFEVNDSTFSFDYNKENKITKETIITYNAIRMFTYNYDKNSNLIESTKYETGKSGIIDKDYIYKKGFGYDYDKITYLYDKRNRVIEKKEDGKYLGKFTYEYIYHDLN